MAFGKLHRIRRRVDLIARLVFQPGPPQPFGFQINEPRLARARQKNFAALELRHQRRGTRHFVAPAGGDAPEAEHDEAVVTEEDEA